MVVVVLLMIVAGVALMQAVSDPREVTLRWLRLGGLINAALLAVAFAMDWMTGGRDLGFLLIMLLAAGCLIDHLVSVQRGYRRWQRWNAGFLFIATVLALSVSMYRAHPSLNQAMATAVLALSGSLLGGFLMTMLLGHAYLTAGNEMTQKPFRRLVLALAALLVLRAAGSIAFALVPWLQQDHHRAWDVMLITTRYLVGIALPAAFLYMIHDCVKRHANQSATGILYVALIVIVLGEGTALALMSDTGLMF